MKQNRTLSFGMSQLISEEEIEKVSAGKGNFTVEVCNQLAENLKDMHFDQ